MKSSRIANFIFTYYQNHEKFGVKDDRYKNI
jgi:hypothetical protein